MNEMKLNCKCELILDIFDVKDLIHRRTYVL